MYAFDADKGTVRVFKGEAELLERNGNIQRALKIKGDRQVGLAENAEVQSVSFNRNEAEDALYNWSSLRSQYLAEANLTLASQYAGYGAMDPGWYWDAGFWGYTWLPGDGLWWSPFGWGFYSPRYIFYGGPVFYGGRGYGRGYAGRSFAQSRGGGFSGGGAHAMVVEVAFMAAVKQDKPDQTKFPSPSFTDGLSLPIRASKVLPSTNTLTDAHGRAYVFSGTFQTFDGANRLTLEPQMHAESFGSAGVHAVCPSHFGTKPIPGARLDHMGLRSGTERLEPGRDLANYPQRLGAQVAVERQLSTPPKGVVLSTLTAPLVAEGVRTAQGAKNLLFCWAPTTRCLHWTQIRAKFSGRRPSPIPLRPSGLLPGVLQHCERHSGGR